ncbi:hypothetical protein HNR65_003280 [Desulfosalsimonas propionicica]|uniref:Porin n=1 Tax=Desulfosalsimonas propionicica TaxID=332175 RepID=A0A7W0CC32_9BACT|nr:hypothetical protein [Desulfosalsimonas propionicica]
MPEKASAFSLEVKNTQVTLGGYAKLLGNYDINGTLNNNRDHPTDGDIINAYDTPLDGTYYADKEDFSMTARESRLYLKTVTPSDIGQITAYVEGDFNGDVGGSGTWSNSRAFRLRHAYGKATFGNNSILAGQCWTTFMDFAAAVPVMDLSGDPGQPFVRQPQVRFTHSFDKGHYLALAIENPDRGLTANGNGPLIANPGNSNETLPDVIVKYFWSIKNFHLSPKLLIRRFELNDESTVAYGASLTSHIEFGKGHKIYLGLTYGDGVGRYGGLGLNGGAGLTASGEIETVEFSSINAGVTINLRHDLAWTVGCGFSKNDDKAYTGSDAVLTANANKEAFGWHTNLKWKITPTIEYAAGVIGMSQEVMDGRDGDMYRVQNYIKYTF